MLIQDNIENSEKDERSQDLSMFELPQQVSFTSFYDTINTRSVDVCIYFEQLWNRTEILHACLKNPLEDQRPSSIIRPALFYLVHPTTVIFQKLATKKLLKEQIEFEQLSRTDTFRWLNLNDGKSVDEQKESVASAGWKPCISSLAEIRRTALLAMREAIVNSKVYIHDDDEANAHCKSSHMSDNNEQPQGQLSPALPEWAILMSIEHVHLTLENYVRYLRHLPLSAIDATAMSPHWHRAPSGSLERIPKNRLVKLRGGVVSWLGLRVEVKQATEAHTVFDEEEMQRNQLRADARRTCRQGGSRGVVQISPFQAAKFKVSNGEFFEFMDAGGYSNDCFWSARGWAWRQSGNVSHPHWWRVICETKTFLLRDTLEEIPMPWDWPVEVTLWEAEAFIRWKNTAREDQVHALYSLPNEAQHTLFNGVIAVEEPAFEQAVHHGCSKGSLCPMSNLDWKYHSASPVDVLPLSMSGINDPAGNLWEWVIDDAPPSTDPDTAPTAELGSHALVGGCWASSGDPATSARYNAGGPCPGRGTLLQHASFRYVLNDSSTIELDA